MRKDSLQGEPVLTPEELKEKTNNADFDARLVFETSGTEGKSKKIPYNDSEIKKQIEHERKAYEKAGITENDVVMTLGAPFPSISGWASRKGCNEAGAEVLNTSFEDYDEALSDNHERITSIVAAPLVALTIGKKIEDEYGALQDFLPNMRLAILFGDMVPPHLERKLKRQWGVDEIRRLYGTVEVGAIAIGEDESERLVPLLDKLVLEIIPEKGDSPINIKKVKTPTTGSLLISDTSRNSINLTRYEIGDVIKVYPSENTPRLSVMGRADNTINLGGALLHERQIHDAFLDVYGHNMHDWKAVVSRPQMKPAIDFYVVGDTIEKEQKEFLKRLFERNIPVKEAYEDVGEGIIDYLELHVTHSEKEMIHEIHELEPGQMERDIKAERIIFDSSYGPE